jgi:probable O-glycosylation ligase (exosortase A-associated)
LKGLLVTYLLTYGGGAAALFNPFIGLLVYICFAIIRPESLWFWSVPAGNYSRIVALCLLTGWALKGFGTWEFGKARGIVTALMGFLLCAVLSGVFVAQHKEVAWGFIEELLKIILPFLVGLTTIDSFHKLKQLTWVILLSHGYVCLEMNLAFYDGFNRLQQNGFGGMDNNCVAVSLVTCMGLAFFLGYHSPRWWQKGLAAISGMLIGHAILFSFSRGGMLAMCVTAIAIFVLIPKRASHYLVFAMLIAVGLRLAGPDVRDRFSTVFASSETRDGSANSRLVQWQFCLDSISKHPILGVGPDHWPIVVLQYGKSGEAHSLWLTVAAELGLIALLCLALFYGQCIVQLWPLARKDTETGDPWPVYLARMVTCSLIGFCVAAQFVSLDGLEVPYYITLIGAGTLRLYQQIDTQHTYDPVTFASTNSAVIV